MDYIKLLIGVLVALSVGIVHAAEPKRSRWGEVVHVTDGDTVWIRGATLNPALVKVRLRSIDAPEICQPGGPQAKAALQALVMHRFVELRPVAHDKFDRVIADVLLEGEDVARWLVLQGHAWSPGFRSKAGRYAAEQRDAMMARRGLFSGAEPVDPRTFRRLHGSCNPSAQGPSQ